MFIYIYIHLAYLYCFDLEAAPEISYFHTGRQDSDVAISARLDTSQLTRNTKDLA